MVKRKLICIHLIYHDYTQSKKKKNLLNLELLKTLRLFTLLLFILENAKIYPFAFCVQMGCVARIGLTEEDLDSYRSGAQAIITMFPAAAPTKPERLTLSLTGFTAGHEALMGTIGN